MTEAIDWSKEASLYCPLTDDIKLRHDQDVVIETRDGKFVVSRKMILAKTTYIETRIDPIFNNNQNEVLVIKNTPTNPSRQVVEAALQYGELRVNDLSTGKKCIPRPLPLNTVVEDFVDGIDKIYLAGLSQKPDQFVMDLWSLAACLEMNDLVLLLGARFAGLNKIDVLRKMEGSSAFSDLISTAYIPFAVRTVEEVLVLAKKSTPLNRAVAVSSVPSASQVKNLHFYKRNNADFPLFLDIFLNAHFAVTAEPITVPTLTIVQPTSFHLSTLATRTESFDCERWERNIAGGLSGEGDTSRFRLVLPGLTLPAAEFSRLSSTYGIARALTELVIVGWNGNHVNAEFAGTIYTLTLKNMYFLVRLEVESCPQVNDAWIEVICKKISPQRKSQLTHLTIRDCPSVTNRAMGHIKDGLDDLVHLAVDKCGINDDATKIIADIATLSSLELPSSITSPAVGALSSLEKLKELLIPSIDGNSLHSLISANNNNFRKLVVKDGSALKDDDIARSGVFHHKTLEYISLSKCSGLTSAAFANVGTNHPRRITHLDVGECAMDTTALNFVARLEELQHCALSDASKVTVADVSRLLGSNKKLVCLEFINIKAIASDGPSGSPFTRGHRCLKILRLHLTYGVTDAIVDAVTCVRSVEELRVTGVVASCAVTNYNRIGEQLQQLRKVTLDASPHIPHEKMAISLCAPQLKDLTLYLGAAAVNNILDPFMELHQLESISVHNVTLGALTDGAKKYTALTKVKLVATGVQATPTAASLHGVVTTLSNTPLQEVGVHKFFDAAQAQEFAKLMTSSNIPNVACCGIPSANNTVLKTCCGNSQWSNWENIPCENCS